MTTCRLSATGFGKTIEVSGLLHAAGAVLVAISTFLSAHAQALRTSEPAQSFALTGGNDLIVTGGKAETVEYQGRKAVRLTTQSKEDVFAFLKGIQFQDGTIEADIAMKVTTPPGVRMPGFLGIAFRARTDGSHYDLFYLRPGNSRAEDQAMRNHSVQYVAAPGFDWYKLRREWPWIYESYADLQPEGWNKVKIEVHGRTARLYVNGSGNPSLIVNGLKGEDLQGSVALWGYPGEEAYFSNVKVIPAKAEAVTNGGEASGTWEVKFASDYGSFEGSMNLHRDGDAVTGAWSGAFGQDQPVGGTWRNGYVELTFNGTWPSEKPAPVTVALAGWIDGDSAKGRMKAEGRGWTMDRSTEEVRILVGSPAWLHGNAFRLYLGLLCHKNFQPEVAMRADRVEVTWDKSKSNWLIRITSGEEVIRRHSKIPKDSDEQTLRSMVQKALKEEGYEPDPIRIDLERNSL